MRKEDNSAWQTVGIVTSSATWTTKSANYTVTTADGPLLGDATSGAITLTLPTAVGATQRYAIKKKDSSAHAVTIATTSAQTIDGASTRVLSTQWDGCEVVSDGSNWSVVTVALEGSGSGTLTNGSNALGSAVTIATSGTYVDGPSVTLPAGTYLLSGFVTLVNGGAATFTAKLWDGTTVAASSEVTTGGNGFLGTIHLSAIVSPTGSTTYKISATNNGVAGTSQIKHQAATNGTNANASVLNYVKIG